MASNKNKNQKKVPWIVLVVLIIVNIYYYYVAPEDFTNRIETLYTSLTEVSELNSGETSKENVSTIVSSELNIYFWDVGQADSILVSNEGKYMLIDAGNNPDGKLIVNQLKEMGIDKIDYLVGTHPHEDHIGGLDNIIQSFKIGKIYMPNREATSNTFEDVLDAISNKNLKIASPKKGSTFKLGEAVCKIVSIESDAEDTNDSSIVIEMSFGKHKYLFTGDLTSTLESKINWEDIDVLKVAHHGSRYSSSKEFLDETKPEIAIISAGKENDYGHPHKEALNRLNKVGAEIYRTDKSGTIQLTSDGEKISIQCLKICLDGNKG